ncbi:MAG: glycosyltransferase family 4 protein [Clostridia bacterium]|jgi:glycosyltransferase involved in cell wall biosynthesis|nr:glycosyltransferase family 4 protein [Clostridia bacterium]
MKILIYQPRVSYFTGGGEIYPLQSAKFFAKLGHDVTILTTRATFLIPSNYFVDFINSNKNVKINYLDLDENFKDIYDEPAGINWLRWDRECLWVARLAYQYISNHKFDIVAVHSVVDALAVPFGQKHVLHLHGTPLEINYICKLILEKEKNLIAVSNKVANKWINFGAYPKIKISTNAIDDSVFFPSPNLKRDIDLLFVGRLIPIKGVQYILQALKILKDKNNLTPNISIVGDGPYKDDLKKLSKELSVDKQVEFCGFVSQNDLIKAYQRSKIAVLPSYDKEGIMSTLLEAASCGTPAITTRGTSMEEFAKDNKNALLVEPENAVDLSNKIYKLLTNIELVNKITENAFNTVKSEYIWSTKAQQLIEFYKEVR